MRTQIITAKLKLLHTAEQANQFSELSLTYTNALNIVHLSLQGYFYTKLKKLNVSRETFLATVTNVLQKVG